MKNLFRTSIILLVCITASCIKNPIHLDLFPIKANPGKFECYINGKDFVPDSNRLRLAPGGPVMVFINNSGYGNSEIHIDANTPPTSPGGSQSIDISVQNVAGTGVYEFNTPEHQEADYFLRPLAAYPAIPQYLSYRLYIPGHGSMTLTHFDVKDKVIAGTFWFNAVNVNDPTDSVKVTGGHFNINYANQ
jgi:hypothetical protein